MRLWILAGFSLFISTLSAQSVIFEETFVAGIPSAWTIVDNDGLVPAEAVDSFDNAWITFSDDTNLCAASTSYYTPTGQSSDYLITPKISLNTFTKLVWSARSYDASYPDDYLVLISATDSLIGSFTDTLMVVGGEYYYWYNRSVQLDLEGYTNQDVFIAFKNITTDGYILMIDNVKVLGSDFASTTEEESLAVSVYPNPTVDLVYFSGMNTGDVIEIYSASGQLLLTSQSDVIDLKTFDTGLYFYAVISGSKRYQGVISKQ